KALHPNAVRVMAERGIDIAGRATKPLSRFTRSRFDRVITLCDKVKEICPEFPGAPDVAHWSMADPATGGDDAATYPAFVHRGRDRRAGGSAHRPVRGHQPTRGAHMDDDIVNVRYMVYNVAAAVDFYTSHFGFEAGIVSPA